MVGVSVPRNQALVAAGHTPPPQILAKLVVDTGASLTSIDCTILTQLGIPATGKVPIHTPSTQGVPHLADQYDVSIGIYGVSALIHSVPALPVVDGKFKAQGIDGLLGRDVLAVARLTYCGADGFYLMSF
jgi:hypothetical protein